MCIFLRVARINIFIPSIDQIVTIKKEQKLVTINSVEHLAVKNPTTAKRGGLWKIWLVIELLLRWPETAPRG